MGNKVTKESLLEAEVIDRGEPSVQNVYKLSLKQLTELFEHFKGTGGSSLEQSKNNLKQIGQTKELLRKLASDENSGIIGDIKDLKRRQKVFDPNTCPTPVTPRIIDSIQQVARENVLYWIIIASALLCSIGSGIAKGSWKATIEGIAISITVCVLILVNVFVDIIRDRKFVQLQGLLKNETVPVIRGKFGQTQSISAWDLVVGDVVLLASGSAIPADCIVISSYSLVVLQESIDLNASVIGDDNKVKKATIESQGDPFLKAGTIITEGSCKAVVCCVGKNSTRGIVDKKLSTDINTTLQNKLKNLSKHFTNVAAMASLIIFILLLTMFIIFVTTDENPGLAVLSELPALINLTVVIFVVFVPEGLPLATILALAFSVQRMYRQDGILVRNLEAPEQMGTIEEVICGKTGTLTTGQMKTAQYAIEKKLVKNSRKNTLLNCELSEVTIELIKECILYNCDARVEMDETSYIPVGDNTEVALLKFLQDADVPIHLLIQRKQGKILVQNSFLSVKRRSSVAMIDPDNSDKIKIFVKGAPEYLLNMCKNYQTGEGSSPLDTHTKNMYEQWISNMAQTPLRVIGLAYAEFDRSSFQRELQNAQEFDKALEDGKFNLVFLGAFGLKDSLREKVKSAISYATGFSNINIRMVSGDHYDTAVKVAELAGIITGQEECKPEEIVMTGEQFSKRVGPLSKQINEQGNQIYILEKQEEFNKIEQHLRVLCRATSQDKLLLTVGLKRFGKKVATTGEGINDIESLAGADVGLAMGSGCSAAKASADLILVNNDFEAVVRSIMWGRNIYQNISRFLQFQLTVNFSAMIVIFVGTCLYGTSPLRAAQLIWINVIMDFFAAIALGTEPPGTSAIKNKAASNMQVLTPAVWRQVIGITIFNCMAIFFLMSFGQIMTNLTFDLYVPLDLPQPTLYKTKDQDTLCEFDNFQDALATKDPDFAEEKCKAYIHSLHKEHFFTYIFNTFVFLQIFNFINSRRVGVAELNVFKDLLHNFHFTFIVSLTAALQIIFTNYCGLIFKTNSLSKNEFGACILAGSTVLLVAALIKFMTIPVFQKFTPCLGKLDENTEVETYTDKVGKKLKERSEKKQIKAEEYDNYEKHDEA